MQGDGHQREAADKNDPSTGSANGEMTHDDNLKALAAAVAGTGQEAASVTA